MLEASKRPFFSDLPLHDVTREFSEEGLRRRLSYEVSRTDWPDDIREQIRFAEELAIDTHAPDSRGVHPYSTHFLRVAIRLISRDHLGIQDPDLLIAALLHDTVEDHEEVYTGIIAPLENESSRHHAIRAIEDLFGSRVAELVAAVTNPEMPAHIVSREDRHDFYREHVREVLATNSEAGLIKLSDFIDNCGGLAHNESPDLALKLAEKYLPLIPDFLLFIAESRLLTDERKMYLQTQLERAENRCLDLLQAAA